MCDIKNRFPLGNYIAEYESEGRYLFDGSTPPDGNGGHLYRDWGSYSAFTIHEVIELSLGMNPLAEHSEFWRGCGTLQAAIYNSRTDEVIRAVKSGIIGATDKNTEITLETTVFCKRCF